MSGDDGRSGGVFILGDIPLAPVFLILVGLVAFLVVALFSVGIGGSMFLFFFLSVVSAIGGAFFLSGFTSATESSVYAVTGDTTIGDVADDVHERAEAVVRLSDISNDEMF